MVDFVTKFGRMKYLRPLYKSVLYTLTVICILVGRQHSTCVQTIEYDFQVYVCVCRGLHGCGQEGKDLAVATFQANKELYHYFATQLLKKDLQL